MRKILFLALTVVGVSLVPAVAHAQNTGGAGSKFQLDQVAADLATANGYIYREYRDGAATGTVLTITCVQGSTATAFTCTAPIPAVTPGNHSSQFTAANAGGESPKSATLTYSIVAVPGSPTNPRIVP